MARNDAVVKFNEVDFEYNRQTKILSEVDFVIRRGSKMALMGQNGAGKSTIFGLISGEYQPESGDVNIMHGQSIAVARQVIPRDSLQLTIHDYFQTAFDEKIYSLAPMIDEVLDIVNLSVDHTRIVDSFSGGQQARLLLAHALIQKPDILLLDEPTNNLDTAGIEHLSTFLRIYRNTVLVISHDSEFLNTFTDGVLYLDAYTKKVEQYDGNYHDVVKEITARVAKENRENARLAKIAQAKKDQANVFANKGGRMRMVAKRMRAVADDMEDNAIDVRKEDKTIRPFTIPATNFTGVEAITIKRLTVIKDHQPAFRKANITIRKRDRYQIVGPNGIGKTTLLEKLTKPGEEFEYKKGQTELTHYVDPNVKIGYYRQDFSTLDFDQTPYEALSSVMTKVDEQRLRSVAAGFLINGDLIKTKIGLLSEGQKGLVAFAQLVLLEPSLLILDEPTNHINFRHLPVIAKALKEYEGALIIISHVPDFVDQVGVEQTIDLEKYLAKKS